MHPLKVAVAATLLLASCQPETYYPKTSGYFKIDTPASHSYRIFDKEGFPYTFEYPVYCEIQQDTVFTKEQQNKYWINMYMKELGGIINITYKEITKEQPFYKLVEDSWGLSYLHHERADYIDNRTLDNPYGVQCMIFTVGGNAATRYQFAATDSTKHFLRGSLYFDVTPNADSLKPATDFLLQDIEHMLNTLKWR